MLSHNRSSKREKQNAPGIQAAASIHEDPSGDPSADDPKPASPTLSADSLGRFRNEHFGRQRSAAPDTARVSISKMSEKLPSYLSKAKEELAEREGFSLLRAAKKIWGLWDKFSNIAPSPWSTVLKYGVPVAAVTTGLVFYQAVIQLGIEALKGAGGLVAPLATAAAFLVPTFAANKIMSFCERALKAEPICGWRRQAILRPAQGALLVGAAIWAQTMNLNMLSYGLWAGATIGTAILATKLIQSAPRRVWAAAAVALLLPWGHLATLRSYDVTVLSAGPDPEVAAWNIGTDLSVKDHWKGLVGLGSSTAPAGKSGMVLINRDVPLFMPPHRSANAFNADFSTLIGKQVRVTTIGGWMKFISPKLQPTIVRYEVLGDSAAPSPVTSPGK